jgi:hypothetical protein
MRASMSESLFVEVFSLLSFVVWNSKPWTDDPSLSAVVSPSICEDRNSSWFQCSSDSSKTSPIAILAEAATEPSGYTSCEVHEFACYVVKYLRSARDPVLEYLKAVRVAEFRLLFTSEKYAQVLRGENVVKVADVFDAESSEYRTVLVHSAAIMWGSMSGDMNPSAWTRESVAVVLKSEVTAIDTDFGTAGVAAIKPFRAETCP